MTTRVMLISPAISPSLRAARFDDGALPDAVGLRACEAVAGTLPPAAHVYVCASPRCRETAAALGLGKAVVLPELAGWAVGRWRGLTLDEVAAAEPEALAAWLADPGSAPHGGESLLALCARAGQWLDTTADRPGDPVIAVAEPDFVRAAVVRALGLPAEAFWRLDVRPLTAVELSGRAGRWNLRAGQSL